MILGRKPKKGRVTHRNHLCYALLLSLSIFTAFSRIFLKCKQAEGIKQAFVFRPINYDNEGELSSEQDGHKKGHNLSRTVAMHVNILYMSL